MKGTFRRCNVLLTQILFRQLESGNGFCADRLDHCLGGTIIDPPGYFAPLMVAIGTLISATWILASNSWMHTPAGYTIIDGRVVPTGWLAIIFNPSFPYRRVHMWLAGDLHGLNTLEYQLAKVAAMEGHWRNEIEGEGVPLLLFGWPYNETETTHFAIGIPRLASLILNSSWDGTLKGLSEFAPYALPAPELNGAHFLKLPLDLF